MRQVGGFLHTCPPISTNKTDRHDITELLLKVALNTIKEANLVEVSYICLIIHPVLYLIERGALAIEGKYLANVITDAAWSAPHHNGVEIASHWDIYIRWKSDKHTKTYSGGIEIFSLLVVIPVMDQTKYGPDTHMILKFKLFVFILIFIYIYKNVVKNPFCSFFNNFFYIYRGGRAVRFKDNNAHTHSVNVRICYSNCYQSTLAPEIIKNFNLR